MYTPRHFEGATPRSLLSRYGFGILASIHDDDLITTHLPYALQGEQALVLHLARANPHWRRLAEQPRARVLVQGAHGYVSPGWYDEPGVPTWNYEAVHLDGRIELVHDPDRLQRMLAQATERFEGARGGWSIDRIDAAKLRTKLAALVGAILHVDRVRAKQKLSQNRSAAERARIIEQLVAEGNTALAEAMAQHERAYRDAAP